MVSQSSNRPHRIFDDNELPHGFPRAARAKRAGRIHQLVANQRRYEQLVEVKIPNTDVADKLASRWVEPARRFAGPLVVESSAPRLVVRGDIRPT
jgi:hypothetical protein